MTRADKVRLALMLLAVAAALFVVWTDADAAAPAKHITKRQAVGAADYVGGQIGRWFSEKPVRVRSSCRRVSDSKFRCSTGVAGDRINVRFSSSVYGRKGGPVLYAGQMRDG